MADQPWLSNYPDGIDWEQDFEAHPLWKLLDDAVNLYPNNTLIDFLGKTYTYGEVGHLVNRAAAGFQRIGVGKDVKVGLFLPNCPQFIIAYYGILKAGGTVVNYSPLYSEQELLHQVEDSQTDIMVTLNLVALYPKMKAMLEKSRVKTLVVGTMTEVLPFPKSLLFPLFKRADIASVPNDKNHIAFSQLTNNDGAYEPVEIDPANDIAVLQYTGGTTGVSKGAMLSHANLYINTLQGKSWFVGIEDGKETMMGVLPFFHVFAMTVVMNLSIACGASIIMHPRFELEPVLKDITKKRPTLFPGVPTMYTAINNHPKLAEFDLSSIKFCLSGGAPLPVEVKQNFEAVSGCKLVEGYGLTESSPIATANPLFGVNKEASIGMPLPGTRVVITDREDPSKVVGQGEDGEICLGGPQIMMGYWGREEATAETIVDGLLHTGDVGYIDDEGYTFIIDRMKDLVLVGGFNVYPRHVEEAIYQHPGVEETTVIGITDDYLGQSVKAFIKLKDGHALNEEELTAFLADKLAKHAVPRQIEFRDELPKTMIGKLSKKELVAEEKAKYEASKAGEGSGSG
jgi:long-chain acyl-CoA synthetase